MASDLIACVTEAATAAIANERQSLAYEPHRLRGIVLDLKIDAKGAIFEGTCYVERKTKAIRADRPMPAGRG